MRELWRVALWALAAASSLTLAVYVGSTEAGTERVRIAAGHLREYLHPNGARAARPFDAAEGRKLAETVRVLTADRERLIARIAALEQNVDDITGSIKRVEKATERALAPPESAPDVDAPETTSSVTPPAEASSDEAQPDTGPPVQVNVPFPRPNPLRREYGVDLGSARSVNPLRDAWAAALRRHGPLLTGLQPMVKEYRRAGYNEYRLIAGPVADAASAARLCGVVAAAGSICRPAVFEGQRLAVR